MSRRARPVPTAEKRLFYESRYPKVSLMAATQSTAVVTEWTEMAAVTQQDKTATAVNCRAGLEEKHDHRVTQACK